MKVLKRILTILSVVILLFIVVSLVFFPGSAHVSRHTEMNALPSTVFKLVNNLEAWDAWMPWNKIDPKMQKTYCPTKEGVGAWYSWKSNHRNVGTGKMELTKSETDKLVQTKLYFMEETTPSDISFTFEPTANNGTKCTWTMDTPYSYNPINRTFNFLMQVGLGKTFDQGLADLKTESEKRAIIELQRNTANVTNLPNTGGQSATSANNAPPNTTNVATSQGNKP